VLDEYISHVIKYKGTIFLFQFAHERHVLLNLEILYLILFEIHLQVLVGMTLYNFLIVIQMLENGHTEVSHVVDTQNQANVDKHNNIRKVQVVPEELFKPVGADL
jgi:hypothetical protein